jgi:hypothetical protein
MNVLIKSSLATGGIGIVLGIYGFLAITDTLDKVKLFNESRNESVVADVSGGYIAVFAGLSFLFACVILLVIGLALRKKTN